MWPKGCRKQVPRLAKRPLTQLPRSIIMGKRQIWKIISHLDRYFDSSSGRV
jgi:hypothetical protein